MRMPRLFFCATVADMSMEHVPQRVQHTEVSIGDALVEIERLEQQERQRGRFDSEGDAFTRLRREVTEHVITPKDAMEKARLMAEQRQDY